MVMRKIMATMLVAGLLVGQQARANDKIVYGMIATAWLGTVGLAAYHDGFFGWAGNKAKAACQWAKENPKKAIAGVLVTGALAYTAYRYCTDYIPHFLPIDIDDYSKMGIPRPALFLGDDRSKLYGLVESYAGISNVAHGNELFENKIYGYVGHRPRWMVDAWREAYSRPYGENSIGTTQRLAQACSWLGKWNPLKSYIKELPKIIEHGFVFDPITQGLKNSEAVLWVK